VLLGGAYIAVSGSFARGAAGADAAALERIELVKGIAFILVTAALGFVAGRALLLRLARHRSALAAAHMALVQAEHHARATLIAGTLAHDLNNMLAVLRMGMDELDRAGAVASAEAPVLEDMNEAIDRVATLAGRLARAGKGLLADPAESVDLGAVVVEALGTAKLHPAVRRCRVEHEVESLTVLAKRSLIEHLVANLVLNAAEAKEGSHIRVTLTAEPEGGVLEVHDDGPGIAAEEQERIFVPFHTTKERGTGLGLLSAQLAAALHGGGLSYHRSPLGGACFRVTLGDALEQLDDARLDDWAIHADSGKDVSELATGDRAGS
jgi:signal transduction histidine kinase